MASGDGDDEWRDNWREDVAAVVGRGPDAKICVKELMDHVIEQGDTLFADTDYAGSWIICHDALSAWWEKEAQDYLASRGFKDRQWRAWGKVNKGTRYHRRLVGNRPELMPLDAHLNSDLKHEARKLVISTSGHLDEGDERRFGYGRAGRTLQDADSCVAAQGDELAHRRRHRANPSRARCHH